MRRLSFTTRGSGSLAALALVACAGHDTATAPGKAGTAAATPSTPSAMMRFDGKTDLAHHRVDLTVHPDATLPYGNLCNAVYLHTVPGSTQWEGSCGTTTYCGQVELVNGFAGGISQASAIIDSISLTGVTAIGAPYFYGSVAANSTSPPLLWSFSDSTGTDFTFTGHVDGVAPAIGMTSVPACEDFGNVVIYSTPEPFQGFTITNNTGATTGTLVAVVGSGAASGFTQFSNSCDGHSLAPGASCNIAVQMTTFNSGTPTSPGVGQKVGDISVTDPGTPGNGVLVGLSGTLTCGPPGNQCFVNGDCCSGSCNVPTTPFCN